MHGPRTHKPDAPAAPIDVLIVDDSPDLTAMMAKMLDAEPDLRVVGILHDAGQLAQHLARLRPRVVLLDLTMPGKPPIDALREAKAMLDANAVRIIAYSGHDDPATAAEVKAAGAWGLLSKGEDPSAVAAAIRQAATS